MVSAAGHSVSRRPPPAVQLLVLLRIQMGDKNVIIIDLIGKSVTVLLWRMLSRMCMQSVATFGYEMKKP